MATGMILGGALGNLIDRIRFGAVTDFIDIRIWPIFNIADTALSFGALLLLWWGLSMPNEKPNREARSEKEKSRDNKQNTIEANSKIETQID